MWHFLNLRRKIGYLEREQIAVIYQAYRFAGKHHAKQTRDSGAPYITHPVAVATLLAEMVFDHQTIAAALLHDVLEDTSASKDDLQLAFGESITKLVDGVSKLNRIETKSWEDEQADYLRKMFLAMASDVRVILIKLADRLHNMRTLESLSRDRARRKARETLDIYVPIANRLGMYDFAMEMEELSFAGMYPFRFKTIKAMVEKVEGSQSAVIKKVKKDLGAGLARSGLLQYDIQGRGKSLFSIYKKMRDKNLALSEILDVYAFRIVVESEDDCYRCLGLVHKIFKPLPGRFKDYIASPKPNQYQSLHSTLLGPKGVPIEVQIRSQEMDRLASSGVAAHWLYKSGESSVAQEVLVKQQWLQSLLEVRKLSDNSAEFIENIKLDLFSNEVYVFTPKGGILELPQGSTVVDFAYAVHTDLGDTCATARVDRVLAPLSTVLTNGQTVEIITAPDAAPDVSWLGFVVTGKARSKISNYLRTIKKKEAIALGQSLVQQALAQKETSLDKLGEERIQVVLDKLSYKKIDDLLESVGLGYRDARLVASQLIGSVSGGDRFSEEDHEVSLLINGTEGAVVKLGECCCPIPGDIIMGIIQPGDGIEVHMSDCSQLKKKHNQGSVINLSWAEKTDALFSVTLHVLMKDERGALASITSAITGTSADIVDLHLAREEHEAGDVEMVLKLKVKNREQLIVVLRHLRHQRNVWRVSRVKMGNDK